MTYNSFKMNLQKFIVCTSCFSPDISDPNCVCCPTNTYETIELEFEVCKCCGNLTDGNPADTEFNEQATPVKDKSKKK